MEDTVYIYALKAEVSQSMSNSMVVRKNIRRTWREGGKGGFVEVDSPMRWLSLRVIYLVLPAAEHRLGHQAIRKLTPLGRFLSLLD